MAAKNKKSTSSSRKRHSNNAALSPVVFLAGIVLTVVAVAVLFLARGPENVGTGFQLEDLEVEIESALLRSGYALDQIEVRYQPGLLTYEVRGYMPTEETLDRLEQRLQNKFAGIEDDRRPDSGEVLIYRNGALACMLQFEKREAPLDPPPLMTGKPKVVIIMDDLGRNFERAKEVINLGIPVTFAILPGETFATDIALLAARSGYEVMIHLPMEPHSYPATNPGDDALLLGQSKKEIAQRVRAYFKKVPYATGANNHMGSRFTEFEAGMAVVLEIMHEKGMFFVDSRTTGRSVVKNVAGEIGVPYAIRDIFLDNVADVDEIGQQIMKLVQLAEKRGRAVGICHPYPETLEALRRAAKMLRGGSVEVVFASKLVTS